MKFWTTAALAGCLAMSGCFDMKQDFVFKADKTAELTFRIGIDAALMALANQNSEKPFCPSDMAATNKEGVTGSAVSSTEGGDLVCTIKMAGPIDTIVEAMSEVHLNDNQQQQQGILLAQDGETYALTIELPPMQKPEEADKNPMAETMNAMLLAKMSGRVLSWSITAPSIIESNGTISDDRTVATYSRPLADAFTSPEPTRFNVTFTLDQPGLWGRVKSIFQ